MKRSILDKQTTKSLEKLIENMGLPVTKELLQLLEHEVMNSFQGIDKQIVSNSIKALSEVITKEQVNDYESKYGAAVKEHIDKHGDDFSMFSDEELNEKFGLVRVDLNDIDNK